METGAVRKPTKGRANANIAKAASRQQSAQLGVLGILRVTGERTGQSPLEMDEQAITELPLAAIGAAAVAFASTAETFVVVH